MDEGELTIMDGIVIRQLGPGNIVVRDLDCQMGSRCINQQDDQLLYYVFESMLEEVKAEEAE